MQLRFSIIFILSLTVPRTSLPVNLVCRTPHRSSRVRPCCQSNSDIWILCALPVNFIMDWISHISWTQPIYVFNRGEKPDELYWESLRLSEVKLAAIQHLCRQVLPTIEYWLWRLEMHLNVSIWTSTVTSLLWSTFTYLNELHFKMKISCNKKPITPLIACSILSGTTM